MKTTVALRNPYATHAANRKAGTHRHRSAPRGGVRNESRDLLAEFHAEEDEAEGRATEACNRRES